MADVYFYDPNGVVPNKVTKVLKSAHTPDYIEVPNTVINPDISGVEGVLTKYWKRASDTIVEMTKQEKVTVDNAITAEMKTRKENEIKTFIFPVQPSLQYTVTNTGLQVTVNVTDLINDDVTNIVADSSETKFILFSLVFDETGNQSFLMAREKTDGVYAPLGKDQYLVKHLKEYSVAPNGSTLIDTGVY